MNHSINFFKDEIRNGFFIPTTVKQAWANTLDVLGEINRICEKHGITYYADWGTILGAVRHGGFIPWDDDLDICMKRDDYTRFREVADDELPDNYVIHDYERHEDHWLFLARVVNNSKMCFEPEYLNTHYNFPWLAGIDIFIKDYLYTDPEEETNRDKEVMEILACADGILSKTISDKSAAFKINEFNSRYNINIPAVSNARDTAIQLYRLAENQMSRVKASDSNKIGQIFPWILKNGPSVGEPKENYSKTIRLPFEDTTIPVPACYNKVLSRRYGNYCQIRKVWDGHEYPYFESQKREMEQLLGTPYPSFKFDKEMLSTTCDNENDSLKTIASECLDGLAEYLGKIQKSIDDTAFENMRELFSESLQLCEDFGTLIEKVKGISRRCVKSAISSLEEYCNTLADSYDQMAQNGKIPDTALLSSVLSKVRYSIRVNIQDRKEILFLTVGAHEWLGLLPFYSNAIESDDTDVYVISLPLFRRDIYGNVLKNDDMIYSDLSAYAGLNHSHIVGYSDYDIPLHSPDTIYFQFPYDGENPYLTTPRDFYSENLRKYTNNLILIPIGSTSEFSDKDLTDQITLKCYTNTPGVIYSDKVYVQSDNIRQQYIHSLCRFAGDDTRDIWEEKINESPYTAAKDKRTATEGSKEQQAFTEDCHNPRHILFCIGLNELSEHPESFIGSVKKRLAVIAESADKLKATVALYPSERDEWVKINERSANDLFKLINEAATTNRFNLIEVLPRETDMTAAEYDAYYGSPSPFVPAFITRHKPVMISDYSIV